MDALGCTAFRFDSMLSLFSVMRGVPHADDLDIAWPLRQGQQCQPQGTDESVRAPVYCHLSLHMVSNKIGEIGKWGTSRLSDAPHYAPLHAFLSVGVPTVLHATTFTAGPKSDSNSQWGKMASCLTMGTQKAAFSQNIMIFLLATSCVQQLHPPRLLRPLPKQ